ncbi:MAG: L-2-amino-thiazoline-4-carboxylic acid hydrolase [bacterium]|nr:L-2-amino-thiazoline-4-carboxylic acid hydrolase [bacterium]
MKEVILTKPERREFLVKVIPGCVAGFLGANQLLAGTPALAESLIQQGEHKFDKEMKLTVRRFWANKAYDSLRVIMPVVEEMGEEKAVEFLKSIAYKRAGANGARYKDRKGTDDFETFKTRFIGPGSYSDSLIEATVVENTAKAFEIKVTECVIAEPYIETKLGKYGYAYQCWGDHCWQDGYNKKIKLIRDKTLMQGHDYCNHRYVFEG